MITYISKRIIASIITLFVIATLTFALMHAVPGGPFSGEKTLRPEILKNLNEKFGFDKPLIIQYKNYLFDLLKLNLGPSTSQLGVMVNDTIADKFPTSAKLGLIAIFLALLLGIPMGAIAALRRGHWEDKTIMIIATLGIAVPSFVVATVGMIIFGVNLKLLPTYGLSSFKHYILPAFALSFFPMSYIARLMRSSMLDIINQDFIRTAKAKGLSKFVVIFKHALKNSILPVLTYLGPLSAYILTGSFVIEKIFNVPGLGKYFIESIHSRDYSTIMGLTIFLAALIIFMNLVVDVAYVFVDPRIKLE